MKVDFHWQGFEWIDCNDADNSVLSFFRAGKSSEDVMVVVVNATPVVREVMAWECPRRAHYKEVLNTDAKHYGRLRDECGQHRRAARGKRSAAGAPLFAVPDATSIGRDLLQARLRIVL